MNSRKATKDKMNISNLTNKDDKPSSFSRSLKQILNPSSPKLISTKLFSKEITRHNRLSSPIKNSFNSNDIDNSNKQNISRFNRLSLPSTPSPPPPPPQTPSIPSANLKAQFASPDISSSFFSVPASPGFISGSKRTISGSIKLNNVPQTPHQFPLNINSENEFENENDEQYENALDNLGLLKSPKQDYGSSQDILNSPEKLQEITSILKHNLSSVYLKLQNNNENQKWKISKHQSLPTNFLQNNNFQSINLSNQNNTTTITSNSNSNSNKSKHKLNRHSYIDKTKLLNQRNISPIDDNDRPSRSNLLAESPLRSTNSSRHSSSSRRSNLSSNPHRHAIYVPQSVEFNLASLANSPRQFQSINNTSSDLIYNHADESHILSADDAFLAVISRSKFDNKTIFNTNTNTNINTNTITDKNSNTITVNNHDNTNNNNPNNDNIIVESPDQEITLENTKSTSNSPHNNTIPAYILPKKENDLEESSAEKQAIESLMAISNSHNLNNFHKRSPPRGSTIHSLLNSDLDIPSNK
ncbi:uncharacterized protein ASCRUDRAFT_82278 [Ascoidea rubescens DSM 1968]|uniref:Uncharacterized protein n=1 Tax=Ascoidea rubescens DSM 1968 TaxID=1344418 RepID=A0A1D2VCF4_9ASCO|nr:hypothetical protein ASCRUDRAFT_82278 [Ascoidea rubescens DSM 1968]ODV59289.1 hypothetical protein ASCRUDRAFT_82278 [Ascoidea rubescens DSM 1968]